MSCFICEVVIFLRLTFWSRHSPAVRVEPTKKKSEKNLAFQYNEETKEEKQEPMKINSNIDKEGESINFFLFFFLLLHFRHARVANLGALLVTLLTGSVDLCHHLPGSPEPNSGFRSL